MYLQCKRKWQTFIFSAESLIHEKGEENLCKKTLCLWSQIPTGVPWVRPRLDKYFKMIIQLELDRKNKWSFFSLQPSFCSNFLFIVLGEGGEGVIYVVRLEEISHMLAFPALSVCACVKAAHCNITWVKPCFLPGGVKPWICNSSKQAAIVTENTSNNCRTTQLWPNVKMWSELVTPIKSVCDWNTINAVCQTFPLYRVEQGSSDDTWDFQAILPSLTAPALVCFSC